MRNRLQILIAGSVFLLIGLLLVVRPCFGQDGDIQDILNDLQGLLHRQSGG